MSHTRTPQISSSIEMQFSTSLFAVVRCVPASNIILDNSGIATPLQPFFSHIVVVVAPNGLGIIGT
jgi:hypothetical protein